MANGNHAHPASYYQGKYKAPAHGKPKIPKGADKELVERSLQAAIGAVEALPRSVIAKFAPHLMAAKYELERDLKRWMGKQQGGNRFTAARFKSALLNIRASLARIAELEPTLVQSLQTGSKGAKTLSTKALLSEVAVFQQAFEGSYTPMAVDVSAALAKADGLVLRRHATSAKRYSGAIRDRVVRELTVSRIRGETMRELTVRLEKALPQIFNGGRVRAETLARTETMSAYNTYHHAGLKELAKDDEQIGMRWDSSFDRRRCPICDALDGQVVEVDKEFAAEGTLPSGKGFSAEAPYPPVHPNCRCVLTAWHTDWPDTKFGPCSSPCPWESDPGSNKDVAIEKGKQTKQLKKQVGYKPSKGGPESFEKNQDGSPKLAGNVTTTPPPKAQLQKVVDDFAKMGPYQKPTKAQLMGMMSEADKAKYKLLSAGKKAAYTKKLKAKHQAAWLDDLATAKAKAAEAQAALAGLGAEKPAPQPVAEKAVGAPLTPAQKAAKTKAAKKKKAQEAAKKAQESAKKSKPSGKGLADRWEAFADALEALFVELGRWAAGGMLSAAREKRDAARQAAKHIRAGGKAGEPPSLQEWQDAIAKGRAEIASKWDWYADQVEPRLAAMELWGVETGLAVKAIQTARAIAQDIRAGKPHDGKTPGKSKMPLFEFDDMIDAAKSKLVSAWTNYRNSGSKFIVNVNAWGSVPSYVLEKGSNVVSAAMVALDQIENGVNPGEPPDPISFDPSFLPSDAVPKAAPAVQKAIHDKLPATPPPEYSKPTKVELMAMMSPDDLATYKSLPAGKKAAMSKKLKKQHFDAFVGKYGDIGGPVNSPGSLPNDSDASTYGKKFDFKENDYRTAAFKKVERYSDDLYQKLRLKGGSAVRSYTGSSYREINRQLRKTDGGKPGATAMKMDRFFEQTRMPEDMLTVRGVSLSDKFQIPMKGGMFEDFGYGSTSTNPMTAQSFKSIGSTSGGKPNGAILTIEVPKGTPAIYVDNFSMNEGEREILLDRGVRYRVLSYEIKKNLHGRRTVHAHLRVESTHSSRKRGDDLWKGREKK